MIIILGILMLICLIKIKFCFDNYNVDYCDKEHSNSIKGIFILMVFVSHFSQYIVYTTKYDNIYRIVQNYLGQLVVALFLFYSGYGIFESIKKNKEKYLKGYLKKRILKTLVSFDLILVLYFILNLLLHNDMSLSNILLSLIGWDSLGNSNWYIFAILIMYLTTYISFLIFKKDNFKAILLNIFLTIIYIFVLSHFKERHWFDTVMCFNCGLLFSYYKDKVELLFNSKKKYFISLGILFLLFTSFVLFYMKIYNTAYSYNVVSCLFCLLVVFISTRIVINNRILYFLGDHIFEIFILQRLPMIVFKGIINNIYLYFAICLIITILLSFILHKLLLLIYKKWFH